MMLARARAFVAPCVDAVRGIIAKYLLYRARPALLEVRCELARGELVEIVDVVLYGARVTKSACDHIRINVHVNAHETCHALPICVYTRA